MALLPEDKASVTAQFSEAHLKYSENIPEFFQRKDSLGRMPETGLLTYLRIDLCPLQEA